MKALIVLNVVLPLLWGVTMLFWMVNESIIPVVLGSLLLVGLFGLVIANMIALFLFWKKVRYSSFIPPGLFILSFILTFLGVGFGVSLASRGTPRDPGTYFNAERRGDLTSLAGRLLNTGYKSIFIHGEGPVRVEMVDGVPIRDVPAEVLNAMKKHGFNSITIDDTRSIVTFGHVHNRHWYEYKWIGDKPAPALTGFDIQDWTELARIAQTGGTVTETQRKSMEYEPRIAYPALQNALGLAMLERFKANQSYRDFSGEDMQAVLDALNRMARSDSGLVENSLITFEKDNICLDGMRYGRAFEETRLMAQLLTDHVLVLALDGRHLKIKPDLTASEAACVERLQAGLIGYIFGNLVENRRQELGKYLGDHWYFHMY